MTDWTYIAQQIEAASGIAFDPAPPQGIGGGCINTAVRLQDHHQSWFVKINQAHRFEMFQAEFAGLQAMAESATIRVPKPLCVGLSGADCFLAMEFIELSSSNRSSQQLAGEQLAALHQVSSDCFGFKRDNTIGATPQHNPWTDDWIEFWRNHRLGYQLDLAERKGFGGRLQRLGEQLLDRFPVLIDHAPKPSLIHGDLWGGNIGFSGSGEPVVFDPAAYFADREADLAMTELFGGFGRPFYDAYNAAWPMDAGYRARKQLYNLYHILNHLNLFGSGYAGQAENMMEMLLADTR